MCACNEEGITGITFPLSLIRKIGQISLNLQIFMLHLENYILLTLFERPIILLQNTLFST